jgi:hypothetical protein
MAQVTTQDLIRFGLIKDPKAYLETESKKWNEYYDEMISQTRKDLEAATSDTQRTLRSARLEAQESRKTQRFEAIDKRYLELLDRQYEAFDNPSIMRRAYSMITEETQQQAAQQRQAAEQEQERVRGEIQTVQRTEAEREAGRARSRRAGTGGRGMLAGYGLSIPQAIGGKSTLGLAGPVGSPTGGGRASTLGRSLLG